MKFYITFGQVHTHSHNGVTLDKDCIAELESTDYWSARDTVIKYFGIKWSRLESESELATLLPYFPRGVIKIK